MWVGLYIRLRREKKNWSLIYRIPKNKEPNRIPSQTAPNRSFQFFGSLHQMLTPSRLNRDIPSPGVDLLREEREATTTWMTSD